MQMRSTIAIAMLASVALGSQGLRAEGEAAQDEYFEKQVRPILVARCYECHSAKSVKVQGGLRVDSLAALLKGGDTGPAIVPGKASESLFVDAINYGDVYQMPPKTKLPPAEIAVLTKWVEAGAHWPQTVADVAGESSAKAFDLHARRAAHWCWQPLREPAVPAVKDAALVQQPLDRFILAKLEASGLPPAPLADKRALIRRATFDLIGLPPTPAEVEAFLRDDSSRAFERVVDRLLDSPHFGERWGRHWLDLVRYAETRGHEFDYTVPNAYQYRDYVIRALNADVPYDQFLAEHLAGDLLQEPREHPTQGFNESIIGTGFWFLGEWLHSPVDIRKDETDRLDNMVDVFSKTFLGLTVSCARCHDHKFDAISQQDYYALFGYLHSSSYRLARFETADAERQAATKLADLSAEYQPKLAAALAEQLAANVERLAAALPNAGEELDVQTSVTEVAGEDVEVVADYSNTKGCDWFTDGPQFGVGPIPAGTILPSGEIASYGAARREQAWKDLALASGAEIDQGKLGGWVRAGRTLKTKTFTLRSGQLRYLVKGKGHVYAAVASHNTIQGPLHGQLIREVEGSDDLPPRWLPHDLRAYAGQRVHIEFSPKGDEDFQVLAVVQADESPKPLTRPNKLLARIAAEIPAEQTARRARAYRDLLDRAIAMLAADELAKPGQPADWSQLASWMLGQMPEPSERVTKLTNEFREAQQKIVAAAPRESRLCLAMWEGNGVDETLLIRGNAKTVGTVVPRRLPEALAMGLKNSGAAGTRLELARQLTDPANPLTSRVIVNRIWQHLLGRGIVPSVDNFGVLGQPPTHPELLDHLALAFMRDGWSIKRTIRTIMLSRTYQSSRFKVQSSKFESDAHKLTLNVEPETLNSFPRRLEGEVVRDAMLAISGRLDRTQFGPSVPVHLTPFMQGRGKPAASGPLDGAGRRSIYISVRRNFLPPFMLAFDVPQPASTVGKRNVTNVPAQALILMNDPFVLEQAQLWAKKILSEPNRTASERIARMYAEAFARGPTPEETKAALAFLDQQTREYGLSADRAANDERVWADFAHVLFNLKEFVFVQ